MRRTLLLEQLDSFLDERVKRLQAGDPVEALSFDCDASTAVDSQSSDESELI